MSPQSDRIDAGTLVARDKELALLRGALDAAARGAGRAVLIGAPAGVGKSELLSAAITEAAARGFLVLFAGCQQVGEGPYAPMGRALSGLALRGGAALEEHGPALARIVPALRRQGLAPLPAREALVERERIQQALIGWLKAAGTPVVLAIEDLHWVDPMTIELLVQLLRTPDLSLVCLGTFRDDAIAPENPIWEALDEGVAHYLALNTFQASQLPRLLEAMIGPVRLEPAFYPWIFHLTEGHAAFLTEVLSCLIEEGGLTMRDGAWELSGDLDRETLPADLDATLDRRLARLEPGPLGLARAAAVLGRRCEPATLQAVAGRDPGDFRAHLETLLSRRLLREENGTLVLPHELLRRAIERALPEPERQQLHLRCAEILAPHVGADSVITPAELIHHALAGGAREQALDWLLKAATLADEAGAEGVALDYRQQADALLSELPLPDRHERQIGLWWEIGGAAFVAAPSAALPALENLESAFEPDGDPFERLQLASMLAIAYGFAGQPLQGLAHNERAMALLPEHGSPLHGTLLVSRCPALMTAGRYDELRTVSERAFRLLDRGDLAGESEAVRAARVGASAVRNAICFQGFRPDDEVLADALAAAERVDDPYPFTVMMYGGIWNAWTGRQGAAYDYLAQTEAKSKRQGAPPYEWALYVRPYLLAQRGQFERALTEAEQALHYPHFRQVAFSRTLLTIVMGRAQIGLGAYDEAETTLRDAEAIGRQRGMALVTIQALLGLGELAIVRHDHAQARRCLEEAHGLSAGGPARNPLHQAIAARWLAELAIAEGRYDEADARLHEALAIVTLPTQDNRYEQSLLYGLTGRLAQALGDPWLAEESFARARAVW